MILFELITEQEKDVRKSKNAENIGEVTFLPFSLRVWPFSLFTSSMWTIEEREAKGSRRSSALSSLTISWIMGLYPLQLGKESFLLAFRCICVCCVYACVFHHDQFFSSLDGD
ncbi:hypothetical protein MLD38_005401 [Melastoma candidum]|uniref:Uncharacterized protein n=1 Tax=Melastoma candidum TaxID=119954 RepID=A0ACB9RJJ1_9MYRT|nr:hypothetical protein MLD38_005401 [Melastoma candidum]